MAHHYLLIIVNLFSFSIMDKKKRQKFVHLFWTTSFSFVHTYTIAEGLRPDFRQDFKFDTEQLLDPGSNSVQNRGLIVMFSLGHFKYIANQPVHFRPSALTIIWQYILCFHGKFCLCFHFSYSLLCHYCWTLSLCMDWKITFNWHFMQITTQALFCGLLMSSVLPAPLSEGDAESIQAFYGFYGNPIYR